MTKDEARKVQEIANQADGGCHVCVGYLLVELKSAFPEHADTFQAVYDEEFDQ